MLPSSSSASSDLFSSAAHEHLLAQHKALSETVKQRDAEFLFLKEEQKKGRYANYIQQLLEENRTYQQQIQVLHFSAADAAAAAADAAADADAAAPHLSAAHEECLSDLTRCQSELSAAVMKLSAYDRECKEQERELREQHEQQQQLQQQLHRALQQLNAVRDNRDTDAVDEETQTQIRRLRDKETETEQQILVLREQLSKCAATLKQREEQIETLQEGQQRQQKQMQMQMQMQIQKQKQKQLSSESESGSSASLLARLSAAESALSSARDDYASQQILLIDARTRCQQYEAAYGLTELMKELTTAKEAKKDADNDRALLIHQLNQADKDRQRIQAENTHMKSLYKCSINDIDIAPAASTVKGHSTDDSSDPQSHPHNHHLYIQRIIPKARNVNPTPSTDSYHAQSNSTNENSKNSRNRLSSVCSRCVLYERRVYELESQCDELERRIRVDEAAKQLRLEQQISHLQRQKRYRLEHTETESPHDKTRAESQAGTDDDSEDVDPHDASSNRIAVRVLSSQVNELEHALLQVRCQHLDLTFVATEASRKQHRMKERIQQLEQQLLLSLQPQRHKSFDQRNRPQQQQRDTASRRTPDLDVDADVDVDAQAHNPYAADSATDQLYRTTKLDLGALIQQLNGEHALDANADTASGSSSSLRHHPSQQLLSILRTFQTALSNLYTQNKQLKQKYAQLQQKKKHTEHTERQTSLQQDSLRDLRPPTISQTETDTRRLEQQKDDQNQKHIHIGTRDHLNQTDQHPETHSTAVEPGAASILSSSSSSSSPVSSSSCLSCASLSASAALSTELISSLKQQLSRAHALIAELQSNRSSLSNELTRVRALNAAYEAELSSFDEEFFNEIEELKYKYQQAVNTIHLIEQHKQQQRQQQRQSHTDTLREANAQEEKEIQAGAEQQRAKEPPFVI